jgi:two-component system CheB/CheR fusion protein
VTSVKGRAATDGHGPKGERAFETLLDYLSRTRGFDFRIYKRPTLLRRFEKRLQQVGIDDFGRYTDYLEVHPEEFAHLFNSILINVTAFFRDAPAWTFLHEDIVPRILALKTSEDPIRAWSAGCATGEEAYSLAMVLAEALGEEEFGRRVKIYASDVDDDALAQARLAVYDSARVEAVPDTLRKYLEPQRDRWVVKQHLRRSVIFGRHNIVTDAPISHLDLLVCRNTLMYFNADTQAQILSRFHFALAEHGYLFLGRAEMLVTHTGLFTPVNMKQRIFTRASRSNLRDRLLSLSVTDSSLTELTYDQASLQDASVEHSNVATIVLDVSGVLMLANPRARALFGIGPADIGRIMKDLVMPQLRPLIQSAYSDSHPITVSGIERKIADAESQFLRVHANPVRDGRGEPLGVVITLEDQSQQQRMQTELERVQKQLDAAQEELQSTYGELETTNEELQSSNEELETTNEELQSSNEELETMNEELQSTNEELQTINDELRQRTEEAGRASNFLESVLGGVTVGLVVVDTKLNVLAWNERAEDLWGLRADEVRGASLMGLDIGLPLAEARKPLGAILTRASMHEVLLLDARTRRGKMIKCRVSLSPLGGSTDSPDGVIMLMEEWDAGGERRDGHGRWRLNEIRE